MAYKPFPSGIHTMAIYKIIGGDHKEYGPHTADELSHWITEGRLSHQSLVRVEASNEWRSLSTFPEFADALRAQAGGSPAGGPPTLPVGAAFSSAEILARQPEVQIGRCLSRSWNLLQANFGLLFGAAFLVGLLGLVFQFIPLIGGIIYLLAAGVLNGGLFLVFLNRIRGRPAAVGDVFAGFNIAFAQLMLAGLLTSLLAWLGLACCLILPGVYLFVAWTFSVPLVADQRLEFWSAMELSRKVVTRVWFEMFGLLVLAFLPFIISYIFAQVRIFSVAWPAMQTLMASGQPDFNHMMETIAQIAKASVPLVMLTKFVFLLNLPFAVGALMYAYEDIFGARTAPTA